MASGSKIASSLHGLAKDDGVKLEGEGRPESPSVSLHGRHPAEVGGWIVVDDSRWGHDYRACRVIKVTDAKLVVTDGARSAGRHFYKTDVLFSGEEPMARLVVEQLRSSAARRKDAECQARIQHGERMAKIISAAEALTSAEGVAAPVDVKVPGRKP